MNSGPKHPVVEKIEAEVEQTLRDFGYELVLMKFGGPPGNQTLSIYIDKPGGVTTNDCQYMTERLSVLLDVLDPVSGAYHLMISSPGVNRPLTRDEDFNRFAGRKAAVTYRNAEGKRATIRGRLTGLQEDKVVLEGVEGTEGPQQVAVDTVEQAHLVHEWEDEDEK
jgi:ribosome maturation factor RimP